MAPPALPGPVRLPRTQLVIVVGVRAQIDARLAQLGLPTRYVGATRITDEKVRMATR